MIFKPFEQIADVESRDVGGAGLGLAICSELLSRMQGSIELESTQGVGSEFTLSIYPGNIRDIERQVLRFDSNPDFQQKLTTLKTSGRVLVVDDLKDLRNLVGHMITSTGAEVEYAENGKQAIEKVANAEQAGKPFDIVFIDFYLNSMLLALLLFKFFFFN